MMSSKDRLHNKWMELDASPQRQEALSRATDHAELTIPRLFAGYENYNPTDGAGYIELYSDTMATLITTRAGKLTDAVFPPNGMPFFNFDVDQGTVQRLIEDNTLQLPLPEAISSAVGGGNTAVLGEYVLDVFSTVENQLHGTLQASNFRDALNIGFTHAQVTGDPIIQMDDDYNFRVYHIGQILIRRDMYGKISEMMLQMWVKTSLLEDDMKSMNGGRERYANGEYEPYYRHMYRTGEKWSVDSEFRGEPHGPTAEYTTFPYFHIGWNNVSGEDYSRTPVEDHFGAITSLEMCHKALAEGAAGSAAWKMRMDPFSQSKPSDIVDTENGAIVLARQGELEPITVNLAAPLQAIAGYISQLEERLNQAWGISAANTLRGERVTAFQIQQASQEVAEADGAILTHVAQSLQKSLIYRMVELEIRKKRMDPLFAELWKAKAITVDVKTGLDALGRQIQAARIQSILSVMSQVQDEEFQGEFKKAALARELVRVSGLDTAQFTYSEQEKKERAQAQQKAAMQAQATQQAIQSTGKIAEGNLTAG